MRAGDARLHAMLERAQFELRIAMKALRPFAAFPYDEWISVMDRGARGGKTMGAMVKGEIFLLKPSDFARARRAAGLPTSSRRPCPRSC